METISCRHSTADGVIVLETKGNRLLEDELYFKRVNEPSADVDIPFCFLELATTKSVSLSPLKSPEAMLRGFSPASNSKGGSKTVPETLDGLVLLCIGESDELQP